MKTVEIIGYKRANLGKADSLRIRKEGNVPCVLYGAGGEQIHFYAPVILFRDIIYTDEAHFIHLNIEGEEFTAILQEAQFHPVSEMLLHVDFLRVSEDRKIKMNLPVRLFGQSPGVTKGGTLVRKRDLLKAYGFPKDMPDHIDVDVSELDFHHAINVEDVKAEGLTFLDPPMASIAVVEVPRAAKMAAEEEAAKAAEAAAAAVPGAEGAAVPPAAGAAGEPAAKPEAPKKDEEKK